MAKIKVLGSCSGTEPMPGRKHTSLVLCIGDRNYFFDAGEGAARSAHLGGIDLLKTRAVFISHTHFDHIGGLAGIFWNLHKLVKVKKTEVGDNEIKLFIPETSAWDGIYSMLKYTEDSFKHKFEITVDVPKVGAFYEDENIKVSGFESNHLPKAEDGAVRSYSYRIELGGKTVVFSGDVKCMDDLLGTVGDGCDILLCETGHHTVKDVCDFADSHNVGKLVLVHHGREILYEKPTVAETVKLCRTPVIISNDGTELEI